MSERHGSSAGDRQWDDGVERPHERLSRNVSEMLAEIRVAQAAVQILFGFLLSIVFTSLFRHASGFEKILHLCAVVLAASSTALLMAPSVWHRMLFRTRSREAILRAGNRAVLAGLILLAVAMVVVVALISKVAFGMLAMLLVGCSVGLLFIALWFVAPRNLRR